MTRLSKRKAILGAGLVTAVVTGCLTAVASPGHGAAATSWAPVRGPVHAAVEQVALSATPGATRVDLPQRATAPFSLVGVTWDEAKARLDGSVEVRVRSATSGRWSGWHSVNPQGEDAPDRSEGTAARGGTAPLWVGASTGVQLRVDGTPRAHLPAGMKLALVDPGHAGGARVANMAYVQEVSPTGTSTADPSSTSTAPVTTSSDTSSSTSTTTGPTSTSSSSTTTAPSTSTSTTSAPSTTSTTAPSTTTTTTTPPATSTAPMPPIATRADWGADESKRRAAPSYATAVKVLFVHHTDTANDYTCGPGSNGADGPNGSKAVIRSLYAYHLNEGWDDIGYNFLVDKCGQLWEGRYGGMDRPVIGAQTYGFNTNSAGVAVLGTYTSTSASSAAVASIARLAAWKLGFAKVSPDATNQTLVEGVSDSSGFTKGRTYTFNAVSGHRDGFATQCPGDGVYAQLPTMRTWAAGPPSGVRITGISGATAMSGAYYTRGAVTVSWSATSPLPLVTRSELLVDGAVASSATSATSLKATLAAGKHTLAVRATQYTGKAATSAASTVVGDTTAPTFTTRPYAGLRGGTVASTSAPMTLAWKAADNALLRQVQATAPSAATFTPTTTSWATAARPGVSTTFALKATDAAGNTGTATSVVTPVIVQESSATRYGTWARRSSSSYLGGYSLSTSARNASLTWTFTGRSVAWVVSRASGSGQAAVYLDGVKVATVDLRSSTALYRNAIWARTWSASARHTLKVVNLATAGRPAITTDGIVYLK